MKNPCSLASKINIFSSHNYVPIQYLPPIFVYDTEGKLSGPCIFAKLTVKIGKQTRWGYIDSWIQLSVNTLHTVNYISYWSIMVTTKWKGTGYYNQEIKQVKNNNAHIKLGIIHSHSESQ